ncbi:hypothetical protein [Rheinheimera maricola]|uniref:DUF4123 domain-containing protein n=1 Tax=Rheinheimera maricola TaxID=2793282 RepID=A0ABS7X5B0_9GAMM|nr:hypothetical protein [Rheinheimera maricola]MBZ9610349.1 hypothetical protein [Rheinheimera maricola]
MKVLCSNNLPANSFLQETVTLLSDSMLATLPSVTLLAFNWQQLAADNAALHQLRHQLSHSRCLYRLAVMSEPLDATLRDLFASLAIELIISPQRCFSLNSQDPELSVAIADGKEVLFSPAWLIELELFLSRRVSERYQQSNAALTMMAATAMQQSNAYSTSTFLLTLQSYLLLDMQLVCSLPLRTAAQHALQISAPEHFKPVVRWMEQCAADEQN